MLHVPAANLEIPLGVIVARERSDQSWRDQVWKPASVFLDPEPLTEWRVVRREREQDFFHIATLPLTLRAKEAAGYSVNLRNGVPSVYVVLREQATPGRPVYCHGLSASPFEINQFEAISDAIVGRVAMPEALVGLVEAFVSGQGTCSGDAGRAAHAGSPL